MFGGNKPVLILPGILMLVMLIGGYQFLQNSETITNEDLQTILNSQVNITEIESGLQIEAGWDWTVMPAEGLYGEDYIGIYVLDSSTGEVRTDVDIKDGLVELLYSEHVIEESVGTTVENGVIFAFSNKLVDHESYGNLGQVKVKIEGADLNVDDVKVQLLHTWTEHSPLEKEDATFSSPVFTGATNVPYWIKVFE
ncbi:hypothetical protein [Alkalihalobacillus deserti]|uniref:hypothetical protein n=1 Tax=Alkalihalobacillus deserti TaxID=2879466 RepID=UPI001D15B369|nr:hypothetical protein [Alkalihalobacillus deserti]